ncbi:MAG: hypothetical protein GX433_01360 [Deltaproteobacteria bacterium]|nr:hypothetical protein [Deltaproteobacteria bacterium]
MEYGLRRYEAVQRLRWFLFFLFCMVFAYPVAGSYTIASPEHFSSLSSPELGELTSLGFWFQLSWFCVDPLGKFLIYIAWVGWIFLGGRFVWLLVQYGGKIFLRNLLERYIKKPVGTFVPVWDSASSNRAFLFPTELLLQKIRPVHFQLIFHPFRRVRLMLADSQGAFSSEDLVEKERRIAEADWQILWGAWSPFQWLLWFLPLLALIQALWLFYIQLQPALTSQKEIQNILKPAFTGFLPFAQAIVLSIIFALGSGLMKRLENLYLSNVDALIYDQFLSRLPFQSSDTLIILETLQRHFKEMQAVLRRLERSLESEKDSSGTVG